MVATSAPQANGRHEPATSPAPAGRRYHVRSLAVAAGLKCAGASYLGTLVGRDGWVFFVFDDDGGQLRRLIDEYWAGELPPVQPRDVVTALAELRREMAAAKAATKAAAKGEPTAAEVAGGGQ